MTFIRFLFPLLLLFASAANLAAPPPDMNRKADFSVFAAADSGYRFTTLDFADQQGKPRHRVYVGIPDAPAPKQGFPALFALDGNMPSELLTAAQLRRLAETTPLVLVLIGHANDLRLDGNARSYDYTPPDTQGRSLPDALNPGRLNGGAADFLQLINQHIRPAVAKRAPLDAQRQTLWGHSYGGLFVLYALLHQPDAFSQYVAADPALWWQQGLFLQQAQTAFRRPLDVPPHTRLRLLKSGRTERKTAENAAQQQRIRAREQATAAVSPAAAQQFAERLAALPGLSVVQQTYPQHNHGSLLPASFLQALSLAAGENRP
ncbi:MAG: alpha/beta hydrolase-fold protein [Neisseria sp.]|nr:alpha/beta hydrolase-fold protein [Neisseria sp.]